MSQSAVFGIDRHAPSPSSPAPVTRGPRVAALAAVAVLAWLSPVRASEPDPILSFEGPRLPACLTPEAAAQATITSERAKYGDSSLRWDWQPGDTIRFNHEIPFVPWRPEATSNALSTFVVWIYNATPLPGAALRFEFGRDGQRDCWFDFGLEFSGWRTCWVAYERDMQGRARAGMNTLRIIAPAAARGGTVYIDSLVFSQPIDSRHHTRDRQVPFVNTCQPSDANYHWLGLLPFSQQSAPTVSLPAEAEEAAREIEQRYDQLFGTTAARRVTPLAQLRGRFATWHIRRDAFGIHGEPIAYPHESVAYPEGSIEFAQSSRDEGLQTCSRLLYDLALSFRASTTLGERAQLEEMFVALFDHLHDQGWADGSAMGTVHHLGYNNRLYYPAAFLMRDALRRTGRLETAQRDMAWLSGAGKAYGPLADVNGVSIDTLNTTVHGQIAAQLLIGDPAARAQALAATSRWLGRALEPSEGLNGGIKADGSILHHGNHYPAYAQGGIRGAANALWLFSNTALRVPEAGHASLRRAMFNLRFQCNTLQWPLSLSGRHPNGDFSLDPEPYRFLALSGTPDGRKAVDEEAAAAWKRLELAQHAGAARAGRVSADVGLYRRAVPKAEDAEARFIPPMPAAVTPEAPPTGHLTLSYGTSAFHRRAGWLVAARGFSRYLWGAEIYPGANLFGRYIAYGQVEILSSGKPVNLFDSGFSENGWDWSSWPGTTAIHLPLELLRDRVDNVDQFSGFEEMLISDEAFAGASNLEGRNGVFALKLHEHGKYNASHRARKSVFFLEDHVVLLGSGITNDDAVHSTHTTLFQQHLRDHTEAPAIDERTVLADFPSDLRQPVKRGTHLQDLKGNSYVFLSAARLEITKSTQSSRSQNDKRATAGDFVTAWIDHGSAPRHEGYAYAILVQPTDERRRAFVRELTRAEGAAVTIVRRDDSAHVVRDEETGILAAACFEPARDLGPELAAVNAPAIVMLKPNRSGMVVSVCDPDLHLYDGTEPDQYDRSGRQREISVYSRAWYRSPSRPSAVRITLAGDLAIASPNGRVREVSHAHGATVLEFTCADGLPIEVTLARR